MFRFLLSGHGATGLDSHTTQRAATALSPGCDHPLPDHGGEPLLGWRENYGYHMQVREEERKGGAEGRRREGGGEEEGRVGQREGGGKGGAEGRRREGGIAVS